MIVIFLLLLLESKREVQLLSNSRDCPQGSLHSEGQAWFVKPTNNKLSVGVCLLAAISAEQGASSGLRVWVWTSFGKSQWGRALVNQVSRGHRDGRFRNVF